MGLENTGCEPVCTLIQGINQFSPCSVFLCDHEQYPIIFCDSGCAANAADGLIIRPWFFISRTEASGTTNPSEGLVRVWIYWASAASTDA
jgi:hypothetical protein